MKNPGKLQPARTGYAEVNGLRMYYELYGSGEPLLLLHGALSGIRSSFGNLIPALAETRRVVLLEQQAHGRTADINRPLKIEQMAEDTAAALEELGILRADILGWSMGAGIALQLALRHPQVVRRLVLSSLGVNAAGFHPQVLASAGQVTPEALMGTPWLQEYALMAPNPGDWPTLVAKVAELNAHLPEWQPQLLRELQPPTLYIIGDSDIVRPEHAVEVFRFLGGGVMGDTAGLPRAQLAILPGTTHVTLPQRTDLLLPILAHFLDAPGI